MGGDFTCAGAQSNTFGAVNTGQTFAGGPSDPTDPAINEFVANHTPRRHGHVRPGLGLPVTGPTNLQRASGVTRGVQRLSASASGRLTSSSRSGREAVPERSSMAGSLSGRHHAVNDRDCAAGVPTRGGFPGDRGLPY